MRILVTFAVDAEFAPWRKLRAFAPNTEIADAYSTAVGDAQITVLLTGIGCEKAWVQTTKIIWDADIDVCISSGLAGALRSEHKAGDVLAARSVNAFGGEARVQSDPRLLELARHSGAKVVECSHSVDHVIVNAEEKRPLGADYDSVDMESGEVMAEAAAFGAKCIMIRAISDEVDENLPLDFNRTTTAAGDVSIPRVMLQVATKPQSIPALIRFGQRSRRAAENLAVVLDRFVTNLAEYHAAPSQTKIPTKTRTTSPAKVAAQ
jgi:adenosylhomocysteine nucleosidase